MEAKDFRDFIDQLSDLSETQRGVLRIALTSKGGDAKVLSLIKTRFAADPACGHCDSKAFQSLATPTGSNVSDAPMKTAVEPSTR